MNSTLFRDFQLLSPISTRYQVEFANSNPDREFQPKTRIPRRLAPRSLGDVGRPLLRRTQTSTCFFGEWNMADFIVVTTTRTSTHTEERVALAQSRRGKFAASKSLRSDERAVEDAVVLRVDGMHRRVIDHRPPAAGTPGRELLALLALPRRRAPERVWVRP